MQIFVSWIKQTSHDSEVDGQFFFSYKSTISPWLLSSLPHLLIRLTVTDIQIICFPQKSKSKIYEPTHPPSGIKPLNSPTPLCMDFYIAATHTHRHTKFTSLLLNEMSRSNGKHNFWCFSIHLYIYRTKAQQRENSGDSDICFFFGIPRIISAVIGFLSKHAALRNVYVQHYPASCPNKVFKQTDPLCINGRIGTQASSPYHTHRHSHTHITLSSLPKRVSTSEPKELFVINPVRWQ